MSHPTINLDELERLALAATPGTSWAKGHHPHDHERLFGVTAPDESVWVCRSLFEKDADYIAAANPAVVLELVRRLRAAEAAVMTEQRAREILGDRITEDDSLYDCSDYLSWSSVHDADATLDAEFDADQLEAIAWWMRNKARQSERGGAWKQPDPEAVGQ